MMNEKKLKQIEAEIQENFKSHEKQIERLHAEWRKKSSNGDYEEAKKLKNKAEKIADENDASILHLKWF